MVLHIAHRGEVLRKYKELLSLIMRLPADKCQASLQEAKTTIRERKNETNPETSLQYLKELAAKIGYLRMTTPKFPSDQRASSGHYVFRDGKLVEGSGDTKGTRWEGARP